MVPTKTELPPGIYQFGQIGRRQVTADFTGGQITSDAGLALVAQLDRHYRITKRFAKCFEDHRDPKRVQHSLEDLIAQRVYGLVQGYEDVNDHDCLRTDPMFGIAVGNLDSQHPRCAPLAGKSTLNRLEQAKSPKDISAKDRYLRIALKPQAIEQLLIDLFFNLSGPVPGRIFVDMDVTDDPVHGQQEQAFFNGYYNHECYAPLLIFCGHHLLAAKLRPSNVDPAAGALEELQRIVPQIQQRWPKTQIIVRGDSAYARDEIMSWCEEHNVDYVLGLPSNQRLQRMTHELESKAKAEFERCQTVAPPLRPTPWFRSLSYRTLDSWSRYRRVVCKLTYDADGAKRRFVVTSLPAHQVIPSSLYTDYYCPRGDMENRLKEHQLDLFSDRTSAHAFDANQLRLWFSSVAYVLMQALRQHCLSQTELATAQLGTIRTKLLKLGAQIRISVRRVLIAISSACPCQTVFATAYRKLQSLPNTS
ncbi:IS1380 family transposase [Chroococcidiopsis sp. CCMEE 29]|uniref:IS1380 family transposase n=1 Tax=Chroococcidiopsis sp. CCMEE 29 TaxID=155894 RepID=UPI002021086D|nr:IS1380 family transposase [Chroococcidiopsis sp. CCMEE 29]